MKRDTYKYYFKVGNVIVHCGITKDLSRRENEHKNSGGRTQRDGVVYYWSRGHISQVGNVTTEEAARQWEKENGCN